MNDDKCPECGADNITNEREYSVGVLRFQCGTLAWCGTLIIKKQSDACRIRQLEQQFEKLQAERDELKRQRENLQGWLDQERADHQKLYDTLKLKLDAAIADRDRLAAVVERLPKDADGNPLLPGDRVTGPFDGVGVVAAVYRDELLLVQQPQGSLPRDGRELRKAAEKGTT